MQISAIMQLFSELFGIKPLSAAVAFVQVNQANTAKTLGSAKMTSGNMRWKAVLERWSDVTSRNRAVTSGHGLDIALQGTSSDVTLADQTKKNARPVENGPGVWVAYLNSYLKHKSTV